MTSGAVAGPVDGAARYEVAQGWRTSEVVLAVLLLGAVGLALVQPWEPIPFPIYDFGGWFTFLTESGSALQGFRALVEEHAREGRVNPLSMAYVALNWALFQGRPVGWQVFRAAVMLCVVAAAYVLLRTLAAKRGAALVGTALFIISDSARTVWILPQAVEHVATLLVLLASLVAVSYHSAPRPWGSALAIAALLVLAVWVREPMVAAVPFVLLLALSHRGEGRLTLPNLERRSAVLFSVVATAVALLNAIPILVVSLLERSGAYASRFGTENITIGNLRNVLSALMLPVTREPLFPANVLFLLAIAVAALGVGIGIRRYRSMLLLAVTLPLSAAAIYAMWPSFPGNYALPYLPASALVFALALGILWESGFLRRLLAIAAASAVIGYGALLTVNGRREYAALRLLDLDMAGFVSTMPGSHLFVAVDDPQVSGRFGYGLALYAKAIRGNALVHASDVECGEAERLVTDLAPATVVLHPPETCARARLGTPTTSLTRSALVRDWKNLKSLRWEATARFWHDPAGQ